MNVLPRMLRAGRALVLAMAFASAAQSDEPRVYTPSPGLLPDVNGDGQPDVDNILRKIDELATVGVKFDDEDKDGNVPMRRADGRYHMACIDLLNVCYRAAGYDLPASLSGGKLIGSTDDPKKFGSGGFRQISSVVPWLKRNPNFHYYTTPQINLVANRRWRPQVPFKIGDMLFVHYDDATDRHSGIVTGVDPSTGLPTHVTNISIYNENQGVHRATIDELFALKCRMISGYARPASWDGAPIVDPVELRKLEPEVLAQNLRKHGEADLPPRAARAPRATSRARSSTRTASRSPSRSTRSRTRRASRAAADPLAGAIAANGGR